LRCSSFRKNLSAYLDGELDSRKRMQIEIHISECEDCRREAEKLGKMIELVRGTERPELPIHLWEGTRQRLETASEQPAGMWVRMPKWAFAPVGGVVLAMLVYLLSSQLFIHNYKGDPVPVTVYLQEHKLTYSEQVLPSDLSSELTLVQTESATEEIQYDSPMSELEMLMEVHYGTDPTNGS